MADTKLSALTEATALTDADELYVNDGGTSKRATVATLKDTIGGPNGRFFVPGQTYVPLLGYDDSSQNDDFSGSSSAYYFPFYISTTITISHLSVEIYSAGTASSRKFAIFTHGTDNLPDALVTNSGITVDMTSAVLVTSALAANITLNAGTWYWLGSMNTSGGGLIRSFNHDFGFWVDFKSIGTTIQGDVVGWVTESTTSYANFPPATVPAVTEGGNSEHRYHFLATLV